MSYYFGLNLPGTAALQAKVDAALKATSTGVPKDTVDPKDDAWLIDKGYPTAGRDSNPQAATEGSWTDSLGNWIWIGPAIAGAVILGAGVLYFRKYPHVGRYKRRRARRHR